MDLEDLIRAAEVGRGNDNLGGVKTTIYVIDSTLVGAGNDWPAAPATLGDVNVISLADFTITGGDLFKLSNVTLHSGSVDDEQVGDEGGRAWMNKLTFDLPKNTADNLGFLSATSNARLVFFVPCNDGTIRIVGNDTCPATRSTAANRTNKKPDDSPAAGNTQEWSAYGKGPALILTDAIADLEALLTP